PYWSGCPDWPGWAGWPQAFGGPPAAGSGEPCPEPPACGPQPGGGCPRGSFGSGLLIADSVPFVVSAHLRTLPSHRESGCGRKQRLPPASGSTPPAAPTRHRHHPGSVMDTAPAPSPAPPGSQNPPQTAIVTPIP